MREHIAVKEAQKLNIPIFAMVDTNSDPRDVDYLIPSNDDASKSIDIIMTQVTDAIAEGLAERKSEKQGKEEGKEEAKTEAPKVAPKKEAKAEPVAKETPKVKRKRRRRQLLKKKQSQKQKLRQKLMTLQKLKVLVQKQLNTSPQQVLIHLLKLQRRRPIK